MISSNGKFSGITKDDLLELAEKNIICNAAQITGDNVNPCAVIHSISTSNHNFRFIIA